ncbi:MAG: hypothetical protein JJE42_01550 [Burkholderiales bacterium]|nr:hypothetical protein [Burkholderiales bacterium]
MKSRARVGLAAARVFQGGFLTKRQLHDICKNLANADVRAAASEYPQVIEEMCRMNSPVHHTTTTRTGFL